MSLLTLALSIIVIGLLLWAAKRFIPMDPAISKILTAVVIIAVILWLLSVFGLLDFVHVPVPRVR